MQLITCLFNEVHAGRAQEYIRCLNRNCANPAFSRVHVIYDESAGPIEAGKVGDAVRRSGAVVERTRARPAFGDIFAHANSRVPGDIVVVANGDIEFDSTLERLAALDWDRLFLAVTREDFLGTIGEGASDVWIFRTPIEIFARSLGFGTAYCDQVVSYLARQSGYRVENPCLSIRCIHHHESGVRSRPGTEDDAPQGSTSRGAFGDVSYTEYRDSLVRRYGIALGVYLETGGGLVWPSRIKAPWRNGDRTVIRRAPRPGLRLALLRRNAAWRIKILRSRFLWGRS